MYKICLRCAFIANMMLTSLSAGSQPPFIIENFISPNKIVDFSNQKLLVIDFWATWCASCPTATKQLEILQETNPDDVFVVALTDEKQEIISTYLQRNPIRVAVLQDHLPNSLVDLFNVQRRPYGVLLTLDGKVLFKGHPSDITASMVKKYAAQYKSTPYKNLNELFISAQRKDIQETSSTDKDLHIRIDFDPENKMYISNGIFYYAGPFSGLLRYLLDCSSSQIEFHNLADLGVSMSCGVSQLLKSKSAVLQLIKKRWLLNIRTEQHRQEAYIFEVVDPRRRWNDAQIDWGTNGNPIYIVGVDRIEADNMTIKEIAALLSEVKGNHYCYKGNDNRPCDWSFHYRYDELMKEDLESNFGIQLRNEKILVPIYVVSVKND